MGVVRKYCKKVCYIKLGINGFFGLCPLPGILQQTTLWKLSSSETDRDNYFVGSIRKSKPD
jgi:hypothetical protein